MALIHLPQAKWATGTGRQVILKSDFDKIERAVVESFQVAAAPPLEYLDSAQVRVQATADCKARVMMCGFPSPLNPGQWVDGGLADGGYRENVAAATLDFAAAASLWGTEKPDQWYCVYALAGDSDTSFTLKAMPALLVSSQATQIITLRNCANTGDIGYGFTVNELVGAQLLILSGASRGVARSVTANNGDNGTGGTLTYGGSALTLAQGDWFMVLPDTNFRYLGMVFNDAAGDLAPCYQDGSRMVYRVPRVATSAALAGWQLVDLGLVAPPTARELTGFAAASAGSDLKLAVSYDGTNAALVLHAPPPDLVFQGVRGSLPFTCRVPEGGQIYLTNDNTVNQTVKVTGWRE